LKEGKLLRPASEFLPILNWSKKYNKNKFGHDSLAAVVVMIMLIPQSLAYALMAGLPPETGLYASIAPLLAYSLLGTSRTLSVGPVAIVSLMSAAAISKIAPPDTASFVAASVSLAFLTGLILLGMGIFKMGFLANFLSHAVINGFISASAIIIAVTQLPHILGISASGHNLLEIGPELFFALSNNQSPSLATAVLGICCILYLSWARSGMSSLLQRFGLKQEFVAILVRISPIFAVIASMALAYWLDWNAQFIISDHVSFAFTWLSYFCSFYSNNRIYRIDISSSGAGS
jgi:SulP family sulfate permease